MKLNSGWVCRWNSTEILVLAPHLCTRIWVGTMISLLKKPLPICQSGWRELQNAFLVIHWVARGPEQGSPRCFADVTRNFKIQQHGWQQGRQEKHNRFYKQNNNFFVHFSACVCTNTTWKFLISRFMEYVNNQRRNFVSLSALVYGP